MRAALLGLLHTCLASEVHLRSWDRGAASASAQGCQARPALECWRGAAREAVAGASSGECCAACHRRAWCDQYNALPNGTCELFDAANGTEAGGCVAGSRRRAAAAAAGRPNIVFLVVESTDGRTWTPGYQDDVIPLPNIRKLQERGATFERHYSNAPVCCPSRATFWSGKHAHHIPHASALDGSAVDGAWNNYEGLAPDFDQRLDQTLAANGYDVFTNGKFDWTTGAHSQNVYLDAWTTYARFAYDVNATGGWALELMCDSPGYVNAGGGLNGTDSSHHNDWQNTWDANDWMRTAREPFFVFTGHEIVHPDYVTNEFWSAKIDRSKVAVPEWLPLEALHPCDFQQSMLKGCTPPDNASKAFYNESRRREVRSVYYAMIAEFDDMVGQYVDTVGALNRTSNTVFVVTSDHGDMQMEHQQFYKMAPYDASASVPMVVADGRRPLKLSIRTPTQLIDLFPTLLDLAGLPRTAGLDGASLAPLLAGGALDRTSVVSQFHGDDLAMSWFLAVANVSGAFHKLIVWGTGAEHPPLLFDLDADPGEAEDLAGAKPDVLAALDAELRAVVNYTAVASDVAAYNLRNFQTWASLNDDWRDQMHAQGLRWNPVFAPDNATLDRNLAAAEAFLNETAAVKPCRAGLAWP